ncbi:MAG: NosD domain-containing protein, partial [Candidatus Thermoplasmatota archaeon]|nr:NosD domain-containing protein [Candidatus Thermoplasmatota archaeon]
MKRRIGRIIVSIILIFSFLNITYASSSNNSKNINYEIEEEYRTNNLQNVRLSGNVIDSFSNPIHGALVSINCGDIHMQSTSDSTGLYHIEDIPLIYCIWNVSASKNGYDTSWNNLAIYVNSTYDFALTNFNNILYVGGNGPNNYSKIQDAIDNATDGDTVFVYHDSSPYQEYLMITKEIDLIGENKLNTIINGAQSEAVITIDAQYVKISGFTLKKNSTDKRVSYGISLDRGYSIIHDTIISDMDYSIVGGGYQCQIINNQFVNCGLYPGLSYFRTIENNTVNNKPLVYLHGENSKIIDKAGQVIIEDCNNIVIQNLSISEVNFGIYLYESSLCTIRNNVLTNSSIIIEKSNECVIRNNQISIGKKKNSEANRR